jgi:FkbM family methyltransferase
MSTKVSRYPARLLFRACKAIERVGAYAQGKGYGTSTIKQEVKLVQSLLVQPPRLAMDIGGNVGDYAAELMRTTPDMDIHVFEPSATNIGKLKVRFATNDNIRLVPHAVASSSGAATLFANAPGSGLGSLTKRNLDHLRITFDHSETISTIRFETYWNEQLRRRPIDIVKIDVEGHELGALQGFGQAIRATTIVQFEFGGCNIDTRTYFRDYWHFFQESHFDLYRITPLGLQRIESYRESDEIFLPTNFISVNRQSIR